MKMLFQKGAWVWLLTAMNLAGVSLLCAAEPGDGPRIAFLETSHDFGLVQPTNKLVHEFIVTNQGNAMLEITAVSSSCACTTAGSWDHQIAPGKAGKIVVKMDPIALRGSATKQVIVSCNDPTRNGESLQVRATVWREVDVEPQTTHFMQVEGETTNESRTVRIVNNLDESITLEPPQSSNPNFLPELRTVKPGKEFELKITCLGQLTNRPQGMITIETSSHKAGFLNISAYAMVQPALIITPEEVKLSDGVDGGGPIVLVRNNSRSSIKITDAAVNLEGATVQVIEANPGKFFNLKLNLPRNVQAPPGQPLQLTFKTTHPLYPTMRIPLVQGTPAASAAPPK